MEQETCQVFLVDTARVESVEREMISHPVSVVLAETFQALADPTRLKLLYALSRAELCVCEIATLLNVSVSAVSHQLRLLRALRLVRPRRVGRRIYYALDDDHIRTLFQEALAHVAHQAPENEKGKGWKGGGDQEPIATNTAAGG